MELYTKILNWITSEKYLAPGQKVDRWLKKEYSDLISRLERKYPEGTIVGLSKEDLDMTKIFKRYKKRFFGLSSGYYLEEHFRNFWDKAVKRDSRFYSLWNVIGMPSWNNPNGIDRFGEDLTRSNVFIWNNRKDEITEEYIKKYIENYVRTTYTPTTFKKFKAEFPNVLAEAYNKGYRSYFRVIEVPELMAIKCLGNLTYEELFGYFKAAFEPAEKFKIYLDMKGFNDYRGFPENRKNWLEGLDYCVYFHVDFDPSQMRE